MKYTQPACVRLFTILLFLLFSADASRAQFSKLDDLASQITKELKPLKPHLVAVVDFRASDGADSPQGHYFAYLISEALRNHPKKKFVVAEHQSFDDDLAELHITGPLGPDPAHPSINTSISADVLVIGTVERRGSVYVIQASPLLVAKNKIFSAVQQEIVRNEFLDSMVVSFPPNAAKAGKDDAGMPSCVHCPDPSYNDLARGKKIQGACVLTVLISAEGAAQQIRLEKMLGYGLDEKAYEAIKRWSFRPARRKSDDQPVAVIVPIEVTFRLF